MTDYQRDYEAMMAWATPHRHAWLMNIPTMTYVCECGQTMDAEWAFGTVRRSCP